MNNTKDEDGESWKDGIDAEKQKRAQTLRNIQADLRQSRYEVNTIVTGGYHNSQLQVALDGPSSDGIARIYIDCLECRSRFLLVIEYVPDTNDCQVLLGCPYCNAYDGEKDSIFSVEKH
ncbi:MAG: hypothetical protein ACE5GA_00105 [Candidatus Zixiibacteriota bacterium]